MAIARKVEEFTDVLPERKSGYFYQGKEIITTRTRGRPPKYNKNSKFYPQYVKVDAATLYAVYGDTAQTAELAQVPESVIRTWKQEPWWIEIQKQVYQEQNEKLAARISLVLDSTITHLEQRLEHGDEKFNPRTGEVVLVKVESSVLAKMFESMAHQRRITRGEPTSISAKIGVTDRLKTLETAFLRFAQAKDITNEETSPEDVEDLNYEDEGSIQTKEGEESELCEQTEVENA